MTDPVVDPDDVPYGRPPVPGIPVPPFAEPDHCRDFYSALAEHLFCLDRTGGRFNPTTFAILSALEKAAIGEWPEAWTLEVAVRTYFPAPWTPWLLVHAFNVTGLTPHMRWTITETQIGYASDPNFWANRSDHGRWETFFSERGTTRSGGSAASDDDMVLLLCSHMRSHPYPFAWQSRNNERLKQIDQRSAATLRAWDEHAKFPYIADRIGRLTN